MSNHFFQVTLTILSLCLSSFDAVQWALLTARANAGRVCRVGIHEATFWTIPTRQAVFSDERGSKMYSEVPRQHD